MSRLKQVSIEDLDYGVSEDNNGDGSPRAADDLYVDGELVDTYDSSNVPESLEIQAREDEQAHDKVFSGLESLYRSYAGLDEIVSSAEQMTLDSISAQMMYLAIEGYLKDIPEDIRSINVASLESYQQNQSFAQEVSLEGIRDLMTRVRFRIKAEIEQAFRAGVALVQSFTPQLQKLRTRAEAVLAKVDDSRREAGSYHLKGKFASKLAVNGVSGTAKTVIETAKYQNEISEEVFDQNKYKVIGDFTVNGTRLLLDAAKKATDDTVSNWWVLAFFLLMIAQNVARQNGNTIGDAAAGAGAGAMGGTFEFTTRKKIKVKEGLFPKLHKLYPKCSAHSIKFDKDVIQGNVNMEIRGSKDLFNYASMIVEDYAGEVSGFADFREPKVDVHYSKFIRRTPNAELSTLTSKEQRIVLEEAIRMIDQTLFFWKHYEERLTVFKTTILQTNKMVTDFQQMMREETNFGTRFFRQAAWKVPHVWSRYHWNAMINGQKRLARLNKETATALIEYAMMSQNATQSD